MKRLAGSTPFGYTIASIAMIVGLFLAFAQPADAHRWSYDNALNDAKWSILDDCGGGWWTCQQRFTPALDACTAHSWCWGETTHLRQYVERHDVTLFRRDCHQHGKQYHGAVYVSARDVCGPTYLPNRAVKRVATLFDFRWAISGVL